MVTKHKSPIKRAKQDNRRQIRNHAYKSSITTATKNVMALVEAGEKEKAAAELKKAQSLIDAAATKGILHRNTVARKVSKLTRRAAGKTG